MPALRSSTLKQRAHPRPLRSRFLINPGLGSLSRLPPELRLAIFKHFIPAETPPVVTWSSFQMDEKTSDKNNHRHATSAPTSLVALLCTSKVISTEVKCSYQNREYQLSLSTSGIVFEGIRSAVAFTCYCNSTAYAGTPRCNHCVRDYLWKLPKSIHNRPLRHCDALKGLQSTLPAMRRLHITISYADEPWRWTRWADRIKRICLGGGIWIILHKAESGGIQLRFTLVEGRVTSFDSSLVQEVLPIQHQPRTTIKNFQPISPDVN